MPMVTKAVHELADAGKAARRRISRSAMGPWCPSTRPRDALEILRAQDATRVERLIPIRHARMAISPWTYYRGAAGVMASDLSAGPHSGITVQMCGDAHVLNFGLWATPERNLLFDLRDFDETLPGPFEWDVKRLATSIVVLARDNQLTDQYAANAVDAMLTAYRRHIAHHARAHELDVWYARVDVSGLLGYFVTEDRARIDAFIQKQARKRTSRGAFDRLTEMRDGQRRIRLDPPFRVPIGEVEERNAEHVFRTYLDSLPPHLHHLLDRFRFVDAVRQIVGVGSVGMQVFLALVEGRVGDDDPLFLQIKQAGPSVYEEHLAPSTAATHGQRVIEGKRLLQTATDIFAGWTSVPDGSDFYVRQFRDMKVIPDSQRIAPHLVHFSGACGAVLARAHARSGDAATIDGYIGRKDVFQRSLATFAFTYAEQNTADHAQLKAAIAAGELASALAY